MASYTRPYSRKHFQIAIICALKIEADAVVALFDQDWEEDEPYTKAAGDFNSYSIGRIGSHNVVVAHMPGMGKGASASLAASFRSSFTEIKLALIVGICGGVPIDSRTQKDIILGDVVISDRIVQIDFGRQFSDALRPKTSLADSLPPPNDEIRGFLNKITGKISHDRLVRRTNEYISDLLERDELQGNSPPSFDEDNLFPSSYRHKHQTYGVCEMCDACQSPSDPVCDVALKASCRDLQCDKRVSLNRARLQNANQHESHIHFGPVASSDQVIRSAWHRDDFATKDNVIAFEMEGAGVGRNLPTLVIKGVCDYADSHKNKKWQGYAAVAAAACLKALLKEWRATDTDFESTAPTDERKNTLWTVPRGVSRLYTGREELGKKLAHAFGIDAGKMSRSRRCFVISGLGGTGKSEACLKFATDHRNQYWGVFWIDCASESSAQECFVRIGKLCGVHGPDLASVKDFLSSSTEPWLLLLDNADNPDTDYSKYIPSGNQGHIIITTRNVQLASSYQTVGSEILDQLDPQHASELLLQAADVPRAHPNWLRKERAAAAIVEKLGRHTLAIVQAGAYIKNTCEIEEYVDLYDTHVSQLFNFRKDQERSEYETIHQTFEISITQLKHLSAKSVPGAEDALHLLGILGFFHHEGSIEMILAAAASNAETYSFQDADQDTQDPLMLQRTHVNQIPRYCPRGEGPGGRLRWRQACAVLTKFSMITISESDGPATISLHPLVHAWVKRRQDQTHQSAAWFCVSSILALSQYGNRGYIPLYEQLYSHIVSCLGHEVDEYANSIREKELAPVLWELSWVKVEMDDCNNMERLVELIAQDLSTGKPNEFTELGLSKTKKSRKRKLDDAATTNAMTELYNESFLKLACLRGCSLREQGRALEAIQELQRLVDLLEERHPFKLFAQKQLAKAYREKGQISDATWLFASLLSAREELAEDHPDLLSLQHGLAEAYSAGDQSLDAIRLLEHVVSMRQKKLPEDNQNLLASQYELAKAYLANEQTSDATRLFEHMASMLEKKFREDHRDRLACQHELARAYLANDQISDAIRLLEHVVSIREKKLPEDHQDRLASQYWLAKAYEKSGQFQKAADLYGSSFLVDPQVRITLIGKISRI